MPFGLPSNLTDEIFLLFAINFILESQHISQLIPMKITCSRKKFSAKFNQAAAYALPDSGIIFRYVIIDAEAGRVAFSAANRDISVRVILKNAEIGSEGRVILPPRLMKEFLQAATSETVKLERKGGVLRMSAGRIIREIPVSDVSDFPEIPPFTGKAYHEVIGSDLLKCIKRTSFVPSKDSKYILTGVLFELTGNEINAVSTDRCRLSWQRMKAVPHGGQSAENSAVVPLKTLNEVKKVIGKDGAELPVKIAVEGGKIIFVTAGDEIAIISRPLEGRFPAWRKFIPKKTGRATALVSVRNFRAAVRQLKEMTTKDKPGLLLDFRPGTLEISAGGNAGKKSARSVPITYGGKEVTTKLNPNFLTDFIRSIPGERSLSISLKENGPVLFEPPQESGFAYILMPLA